LVFDAQAVEVIVRILLLRLRLRLPWPLRLLALDVLIGFDDAPFGRHWKVEILDFEA
jgi:hypothetical protein